MSHDWSQLFKFVSFYGHVHSGHVTNKYLPTIGQNYFKFVPFYGKADDVVFNGFTTHSRKPQRKMHIIGIFFIYYKKFINR